MCFFATKSHDEALPLATPPALCPTWTLELYQNVDKCQRKKLLTLSVTFHCIYWLFRLLDVKTCLEIPSKTP